MQITYLGHIRAVGRMDHKSDKFDYANDLFGTKNSQRQFFSVPQRGVADTKKFAEWLYKPSTNCKTDNECVPYEDLRYINIIR